ncbi:hypothetical protein BLAT2472_60290 [Burkholderia latens]
MVWILSSVKKGGYYPEANGSD